MIGRQTRFDLQGEQFVRLLKYLEENCHCRYFFGLPDLKPGEERYFSASEYSSLKPKELRNLYAVEKGSEHFLSYRELESGYRIHLDRSHVIDLMEANYPFFQGRLYFVPTFVSNDGLEYLKADEFLQFCDRMFKHARKFARKAKKNTVH